MCLPTIRVKLHPGAGATEIGPQRRTPSQLIHPVDHPVTDKSRSTHSPLVLDNLPTAQAAAMLYANGREKEAEGFLRRALEPGAPEENDPELWHLLFDLLRVRGEWVEYEELAKRFESRFGTTAPQWLNAQELARLPEELRPGGAGYFELGAAVDGSRKSEFDRVRAAARKLAHVHLDLSRVANVDEEGCRLLAGLLRELPDSGTGMLLTGADHLADLLREAAAGNPGVDSYWVLLLHLHRLRGLQKDFERTAVEYALAAGVKPPDWQPMVMPLAPRVVPQERRDEPRYGPGPEAIRRNGVMWGATDSQLSEVQQFVADRRYVNIDLSELRRIDFSCGNALAKLVNDLAASGKIVRLIRPNALVAGFLAALNLDPGVTIVPANRFV